MKKIFLGLVVLAACSASDPVAENDANVVNVEIGGPNGNQFSPRSAKVKVGQTVRWTWKGGSHNVVSGAQCQMPDDKFRSGAPTTGGTFDKKFEVAGTFPYYCEPHCEMGMKAEIVVE